MSASEWIFRIGRVVGRRVPLMMLVAAALLDPARRSVSLVWRVALEDSEQGSLVHVCISDVLL